MVEKINMKETIKRLFLVCTLLRARNKNDLCNAREVKKVFWAHPNPSNKFLISSANNYVKPLKQQPKC